MSVVFAAAQIGVYEYVYPDTREAIWHLVEAGAYSGRQGTPYYHMTTTFQQDSAVAVQIILLTGEERFLERVDRLQVDVYAEGAAAAEYAEAFKEAFTGTNLTVDGVGLLDVVTAELAPHDVPYPSDRINVSSAVYRVTVRPKSP